MRRRDDGFLLVTVLFIMVVVSILALGTSFTSMVDRQVASRHRVGTEAYYLAQAGLDRLKTGVFRELSAQALADIELCGFPAFTVDLGGGVVVHPGVTTSPIPFEPITNGWYELLFERSGGYYVLTSTGYLASDRTATERSGQATVQLVAAVGERPSRVWDNAIFARALASGSGSLTGTIAAYGSVHVVNGDVELDSADSLVASGSSGIFNNYNGRGTQTNTTGAAEKGLGTWRTQPDDLCSRLKVAQGDVRVQSSATGIGAAGDQYDDHTWVGPLTAGGQIQSIKGVYLGTGSVVDQHGEPLTPDAQRTIYSRTGVSGYEGFDLPFPTLDVGFPYDADTLVSGCGLIVDGVLTLPPADRATSISCTSAGGETSIGWDADTGLLVLAGTVSLPDGVNVDFRPRTGNEVLRYTGVGELRVGRKTGEDPATSTGRIDIGMEVLPANPDANYISHALALVTAGDIHVDVSGGGSTISALMYSDRRIDIQKQPNIVGAVVGRTVNVHNVPKILYHRDAGRMAEEMCLWGTRCAMGAFSNPGPWSEVSLEVR